MKDEDKGGEGESISGSTVDNSLKGEIEGAITDMVERAESARKKDAPPADDNPDPDDDLPPGESPSGDDAEGDDEPQGKGGDGAGGDDDPPVVDDAIIERAVKAGMSLADARSFQTADALGRMCDMLEKRADAAEGGEKAGQSVADADPLAGVEDLDPEQYDEKLVTLVKGLKDVIRTQHKEIVGLKRSSETDGQAVWFESQVKSLGDEYVKALGADKNKRTALEDKFAVLQAGYKAAGKTVGNGDVFKEAVSIVLGDVQLKEQVGIKAKALADRRMKHIAKPQGSRMAPVTSASADVASEIDRKFFGRK